MAIGFGERRIETSTAIHRCHSLAARKYGPVATVASLEVMEW